MNQPMSRRSLLVGAGAMAFLAACGKDKNNGDEVSVTTTTEAKGQADVLSTVIAGFNLQTGLDERVTGRRVIRRGGAVEEGP